MMNRYLNNEITFSIMLKQAVRLHYLTLKHTIPFILAITIIKYAAVLLASLFSSDYVRDVIYIIAGLGIAYFFAAALLTTHRAFIDKSTTVFDIVSDIAKRIKPIFITLLVYVAGVIAIYYFMQLVLIGVDRLIVDRTSALHGGMAIISAMFCILYAAMFYFSFAIAVIDEKPFHKAFYNSALLSEKEKFSVMVLFIIFFAVIILLTPATISEYLLSSYHLGALFDFVVLCVAVPLYINLLLLTINDAKQQVLVE